MDVTVRPERNRKPSRWGCHWAKHWANPAAHWDMRAKR